MKVLNLRCGHDHRFEGWFASVADYVAQQERQQVACPLCDDTTISRLPSAPRLITSRAREQPDSAASGASTASASASGTATSALSADASGAAADATLARLHTQWLSEMRQMISKTEDVGDQFSEEARRIHYGEVKERGIRGHATPEDAQALRDEGIDVMAIALPAALKGPIQ